jgi:hypothetical protein
VTILSFNAHKSFHSDSNRCKPKPVLWAAKRTDDAGVALKKGSVLIQGGIGIGKSSLLAQVRLRVEGFGTTPMGEIVCIVGHKHITNVDDLARPVLDLFVEIDESSNAFKLKVGGLAEYENVRS